MHAQHANNARRCQVRRFTTRRGRSAPCRYPSVPFRYRSVPVGTVYRTASTRSTLRGRARLGFTRSTRARPSAHRRARMTAPLSCTRNKTAIRSSRSDPIRSDPIRSYPIRVRIRAKEWRAVRGGAHGVGAGVGDDDGAPVLHKKRSLAKAKANVRSPPNTRHGADVIAVQNRIIRRRRVVVHWCGEMPIVCERSAWRTTQ